MILTEQLATTAGLLPESVSDEVVLLDGRIVKIKMGMVSSILDRDGNANPLRFDILQPGNRLHESIYSSFKITLSTHSLSYNATTSYALSHWLTLPEMQHKSEIGIPEINLLNKIPASYQPFTLPLLRRMRKLERPGLSDEVHDFLDQPFKWEQQSTGAYFGLITNDPERGAFTEQEIHNISQTLNSAYAEGTVSQADYTISWFFIGTGVRPVQAYRILRKDVKIHSKDGLEVTLRIPLAKGEMSSSQESWIRRAPTVLAECLIHYLDAGSSETNSEDKQRLFKEPSPECAGSMPSRLRAFRAPPERPLGDIDGLIGGRPRNGNGT